MSDAMSRHFNRTMTCTKKNCHGRRFMDTDRCFDHQHGMFSMSFFKAWFVFCAILALAMFGLMVWGGIEIVTWVTSR